MRLKDYLELEKKLKHHPNIVKDNIGDAILYHSNPIFRCIRDRIVKMDFQFTLEDPYQYFSCKLNALDRLKSGRILPYLPNRKALVDLERKSPGLITLKDVNLLRINWNATSLHECCHIIASRLMVRNRSDQNSLGAQFVLNANLEEAFADIIEYFCQLYINTEAEKFSSNYNMYVQVLSYPEKKLLREAIQICGMEVAIKSIILLCLSSHFLIAEVGTSMLKNFEKLIGPSPLFSSHVKQTQLRKKIYKMLLFQITPFRIGVGSVYFKGHRYKSSLKKTLNFDPAKFMLNDREYYLRVLDQMVELITIPNY